MNVFRVIFDGNIKLQTNIPLKIDRFSGFSWNFINVLVLSNYLISHISQFYCSFCLVRLLVFSPDLQIRKQDAKRREVDFFRLRPLL